MWQTSSMQTVFEQIYKTSTGKKIIVKENRKTNSNTVKVVKNIATIGSIFDINDLWQMAIQNSAQLTMVAVFKIDLIELNIRMIDQESHQKIKLTPHTKNQKMANNDTNIVLDKNDFIIYNVLGQNTQCQYTQWQKIPKIYPIFTLKLKLTEQLIRIIIWRVHLASRTWYETITTEHGIKLSA